MLLSVLYVLSYHNWALITLGIDCHANWLERPAVTTVEELLCRSRPYRAGLTSVELCCSLSSPLECITHGDGWVASRCCLKLSNNAPTLEPPKSCKVSYHLCPAWGTQYKPQSNLKMAATCAKVWGSQERPSWEPKLASPSARPEAMYTGVHRGQILLIWEILGKYKAWDKRGHLYGKNTGKASIGPTSWVKLDLSITRVGELW